MRTRRTARTVSVLAFATMAFGSLVPGAGVVQAAPASPTLVAAGTSTARTTVYPLGTASFSAGHLYVAFVSLSESGDHVDATPGIVGAGTSWTQIDKGEGSASTVGMTAYLFRPTSDVSAALTTGVLATGHEGIWYAIVDVELRVRGHLADRPVSGRSVRLRHQLLGEPALEPEVGLAGAGRLLAQHGHGLDAVLRR